jgi:DNA-binding transcriptional MerR regulator
MASVARRSIAPARIKPKLGRDDFLLRAVMAVIGLYLLITLAFPLWAMLSKSFETYELRLAEVEVAGFDGSAWQPLGTLEELAARSGVPRALIDSVVQEGLLVPRRHEGDARFTTADIEIVAAGLRLLETGLPMPELLALARRHHAATRETAEAAVAMFDTYVREPLRAADLSDDERAERLVEAFRELLPSVSALVAHHFRRVLLEVAQEHLESVGEPAELAAANVEARRRLEVVWPR